MKILFYLFVISNFVFAEGRVIDGLLQGHAYSFVETRDELHSTLVELPSPLWSWYKIPSAMPESHIDWRISGPRLQAPSFAGIQADPTQRNLPSGPVWESEGQYHAFIPLFKVEEIPEGEWELSATASYVMWPKEHLDLQTWNQVGQRKHYVGFRCGAPPGEAFLFSYGELLKGTKSQHTREEINNAFEETLPGSMLVSLKKDNVGSCTKPLYLHLKLSTRGLFKKIQFSQLQMKMTFLEG